MGALSRLAGSGGCEVIDDTVEVTGKNYVMLVFQEDTVVLTLTGTSDADGRPAVDFFVTMGLSGATLKQGAILTVPAGSRIDTLDLTSGSVIAYKESEQ